MGVRSTGVLDSKPKRLAQIENLSRPDKICAMVSL
jgi:hypothetical protein